METILLRIKVVHVSVDLVNYWNVKLEGKWSYTVLVGRGDGAHVMLKQSALDIPLKSSVHHKEKYTQCSFRKGFDISFSCVFVVGITIQG